MGAIKNVPIGCMNTTMARLLISQVETVFEIEGDDERQRIGPVLQVHIAIDITKPLCQGVCIQVGSLNEVLIAYEISLFIFA